MDIFSIIFGLLLLLLGRRIFWIFVGGVGFLMGLEYAPTLLQNQSELVVFLVAVTLAIVGALLAILFQRVAIAVAGGFAGAILVSRLMAAFGWGDPNVVWIASIAGGVVAAIIVSLLFDWALVILTSLTGAVMVCGAITLSPPLRWIIGIALVVIGILVQSFDLSRRRTI